MVTTVLQRHRHHGLELIFGLFPNSKEEAVSEPYDVRAFPRPYKYGEVPPGLEDPVPSTVDKKTKPDPRLEAHSAPPICCSSQVLTHHTPCGEPLSGDCETNSLTQCPMCVNWVGYCQAEFTSH